MLEPGDGSLETGNGLATLLRVPRVRAFIDVALPGLYAWSLTVAVPAVSREAPLSAKLFALAAAPLVVAGGWFALQRPVLARGLGLWGFCAACVATWSVLGSLLAPGRLDPLQGMFGALGWALFALGWGGAPKGAESLPNPVAAEPAAVAALPARSEPLLPRARLAPGAALITAFGTVCAAVMLAIAFRVQETERALFAHGVALAGAVALVGASGVVASERGRPKTPPRSAIARMRSARSTIFLLLVLVAFGLALAFLR